MTYLEFVEMVQKCNWNPISQVFLEHWEPDDGGGKQCVRILATNVRFDTDKGEVIISGTSPTFNGKS